VAVIPPGTYKINNLVIPSGACLIGYSAFGYGNSYGVSNKTILVALSSSTVRVLNVDGASNVMLAGFQIDCDYALNNVQNATCGNDSPAVWARESGTSGNISFVGNDLSGTTVPMPMALANTWSGNLPTSYTFSNNLGLLMDERTSGRPVVKSGFPYQDLQNINLSASSTGSIQFVHDPVPAFSGMTHKLRVTARNQSTGTMYSAEFNYLIQREGGAPTITPSPAFGTIGTSGYIGFGSGTLQLGWTGIAADVSTYALSVQNTSGATHYVTAQLF